MIVYFLVFLWSLLKVEKNLSKQMTTNPISFTIFGYVQHAVIILVNDFNWNRILFLPRPHLLTVNCDGIFVTKHKIWWNWNVYPFKMSQSIYKFHGIHIYGFPKNRCIAFFSLKNSKSVRFKIKLIEWGQLNCTNTKMRCTHEQACHKYHIQGLISRLFYAVSVSVGISAYFRYLSAVGIA